MKKQTGRIQRNFQQPNALASTAQQASKLNIKGLEGVMNGSTKWVQIPTYYYDFEHLCLPLSADECEDKFGGTELPIFNVSGLPNRFTNAAIGSGVNEVFLALGAGVIAMGEGESFTVHGASVAMPDSAGDTPLVDGMSLCDNYCGAVDLSDSDAGLSFATFWWGGPTWKIIEKFFRAYRLVIKLAHRFEIVNESLFDVGMTPTPPEFVGASDSFIPALPYIEAVNNRILEGQIASTGATDAVAGFLPPNAMDSDCLPAPIAPVTYGHPRITGLANRMYCFAQPIMFLPGMSFEVFFQQAAPVCTPDICNIATVTARTPGTNFNLSVNGLECPGALQLQFPGGTIDLGVVFKGFALWPSAAVHYLQRFLVGGSAMCQAMNEEGVLNGILGAAIADLGAADAIKGVLEAKPEDIR